MSPEAALILCRFLTDGSAIFLWGTSGFLSTLVPDRLARVLDRRLRYPQLAATIVLVAATIMLLPLRSATIGNGWSDTVDPDTVSAVLLETNIGAAWVVQSIAAICAFVAAFVPARQRLLTTTLSIGGVFAAFSMTGHAAMNTGWLGLAHHVSDFLHLAAAGAWLGSLVPIMLLLSYLPDPSHGVDARLALMRFSTAGHVAVALVIATGLLNMLLIVGGLPSDWSLTYQVMLAAKIGLVAVMMIMAITNRYVFVPLLPRKHQQAMTGLVLLTFAEITVGIVVVGTVAWFGTLEPT